MNIYCPKDWLHNTNSNIFNVFWPLLGNLCPQLCYYLLWPEFGKEDVNATNSWLKENLSLHLYHPLFIGSTKVQLNHNYIGDMCQSQDISNMESRNHPIKMEDNDVVIIILYLPLLRIEWNHMIVGGRVCHLVRS